MSARKFQMPRATSLVVVAIVGMTAVTAASPFVLNRAVGLPVDWVVLSDIGQTYGAVSALLSALALSGVVASLVFQGQQVRVSRKHAYHSMQFDLMRLAFGDPETLAPVWGRIERTADAIEWTKRAYVNLIVVHLWLGYETGGANEQGVRNVLEGLFQTVEARRYWATARPLVEREWKSGSSRERKFFEIVDAEARRIMDRHPVAATLHRPTSTSRERRTHVTAGPFVAGIALGVVASWLGSRRSRGRDH